MISSANWYRKKSLSQNIYIFSLSTYFFTLGPFFMGKGVYCPCCQRKFKKFYPDGMYGQCSRCGSGARHRLFVIYLEKRTNFFTKNLKSSILLWNMACIRDLLE